MAVYFPGTGWSHLYKNIAAVGATTEPLTLSCWFKVANVTSLHPLSTICYETSKIQAFSINTNGDVASDPVSAYKSLSLATRQYVYKYSYLANTWYHIAGVFTNNSSRVVYLNGSVSGEGTTYLPDPTNIDFMQVGYNECWGAARVTTGTICEVAVWKRALSGGEILSMYSKQLAPSCFPTGLAIYHKLIDNYTDEMGGNNLVAYGTPSFVAHPTINYTCDNYGPKIQVI